jgi:bacteriorhodopsin
MFEQFTGRAFFLMHGSVGFLCFAYFLGVNVVNYVDSYSALDGRRLISEQEKEMIVNEQMRSASRISVMFSSAFFFLMSVWLMSHQTELNFGLVQRSVLGKRLDFCMTLSLYISFFSALFNAIQLMDDDNLYIKTLEGDALVLDLGRPVEWMLTCPLMQLAVPILAGEKISDSRRLSMPILAFVILSFGLASTVATNVAFKALLYCAGFLLFLVMCGQMNACVSEASGGGENLFVGSSFLRGLVVIIALTWIPFPIWYALSPEGFNIIKDAAGMKVAVAFLNVFSKGSFMMYLARIRTDHNTRQKTLVACGYIDEMDGIANAKAKAANQSTDQVEEKDSDTELDKVSCMLVKEVLETMGRSKDYQSVLDRLQAHLITCNDDILALTKDYCVEIDIPWGLILALKSKIRSYNIQLGDAWSMQGDNSEKMANVTLSLAAPHIAKDKKKIEYVVRRQSSKDLHAPELYMHTTSELADNASSEMTSQYPRSPRAWSNSPFADSQSVSGAPNDEVKKLAILMQDHQKNVNGQVDECRDFVMQSMDKIMGVLEQRLDNNNPRPAKAMASPASAPAIPHLASENVAQPAI